MMALFSSVMLEASGGRAIEYIGNCYPNLLMNKLLTSTDDQYESCFVRNQGNRDQGNREIKVNSKVIMLLHK